LSDYTSKQTIHGLLAVRLHILPQYTGNVSSHMCLRQCANISIHQHIYACRTCFKGFMSLDKLLNVFCSRICGS